MITYYAAHSIDGFIAGPNGELDWLPQGSREDDFGYSAFYATQEVVVMGRKTWQISLGFGEWHYGDKDCYVLTRGTGLKAVANERFIRFDAKHWRELSKTKKIYLNGGGEVAKLFMEHGLVDRLELAVVPAALGLGLPLFAQGFPLTRLRLIKSSVHPTGLVMNSYEVLRV